MKSFLAVLCACVIAVQAHTDNGDLLSLLNPPQRSSQGGGMSHGGGESQGGNAGSSDNLNSLLNSILANLLTQKNGMPMQIQLPWQQQQQQQQQQPQLDIMRVFAMFQQLMMGQKKHHDSSDSEEDKLNKDQKAILDMHMYKQLFEGFKMYTDYKNAENEFTHMMTVLCTMMKVSEDYSMANNKTWQNTTDEEVEKMNMDSKDMTPQEKYMFLMKEINGSEERFFEILMRVNMGVCHSAKAYHAMEEKVQEKMEREDKK